MSTWVSQHDTIETLHGPTPENWTLFANFSRRKNIYRNLLKRRKAFQQECDESALTLDHLLNNFKCPGYISRFGITERGYIGRVPIATRRGDLIVILLDAKVPHVLRRVAGTHHYRLLGEYYIHGIMKEAFMRNWGGKTQDFILK
ncbi:hypothetical protein NA56DRAFT_706481 [Hyaloscypha hepaticicola]|uniref:Uncharacterized protein n=1 Tax=Hyaloscypha hepaticicola TaxID=2082293 RepID=A0A2J6PX35_9HELO|nr:hypothetical protein NA56DRAFT_706481 [Hyaloscypha hepaticicola]